MNLVEVFEVPKKLIRKNYAILKMEKKHYEEKVSDSTVTAFFKEFWKITHHSGKYYFILGIVFESSIDSRTNEKSRWNYYRK